MPKSSHFPRAERDGSQNQRAVSSESRNTDEFETAQEALQAGERRFRSFLELSKDWYWEQDEHFRFTWVSENVKYLAGTAETSHIGKKPWELPLPASEPTDWSSHQAVLARHESFRNFEHKSLNDNGDLIWLSTNGNPIFDSNGHFKCYRGTSRNITQQKITNADLKVSEGRLRLALGIARIGIWEWDMISDQVFWDDRQFELFGISKVEGTIPLSSVTDVIHPEDRERLADSAKKVLEGGATAFEEFRITRPDGSVRWLLGCNDIVQVSENEASAMLVGVNLDITEIKETEIALRRSELNLKDANVTLENRIAERTAELEDEAERHAKTQSALAVSQRLESIGQLTGGIAHDFNNLLAVILGNAELLGIEFASTRGASLNIDAIKKSISRGASLTERLLAFARKTALRPVATDVASLIDGLRDMFQRTLGAPIELRINSAPELWLGMIDPHQFEGALVNLAINARDAMPRGGVLAIEASNTSVTDDETRNIEDLASGDYVKVTVIDTGDGISPANLKKVIDPFFTTKEVGMGSGLGLSMVYGFALQSKGNFTIDSEVGLGTTAILYLPSVIETETENHIEEPVTHRRRNSERILVVEDDPEVRKICASTLRNQGFEVFEASDGKEAVKQLSDNRKIDLLLTDIILPGEMNGAEIAVKAKAMHSNIKVVYTTGFADVYAIEHLALDPDIIRINKPYPRKELFEKIWTALAT